MPVHLNSTKVQSNATVVNGENLPSDKSLWDQQLRARSAYWFARVREISDLSVIEIARLIWGDEAEKKKTTLHALARGARTTSGAVMDAVSRVTGVPLPLLKDELNYVSLIAARIEKERGGATDGEAEQRRRDALANLRGRPAAKKKAKGQ